MVQYLYKFKKKPISCHISLEIGRVAALGSLFSDRFPICSSFIVFSV